MIRQIHIPKTAGTSIQSAINSPSFGHRLLSEFITRSDDHWFACVRNPYDRAVSTYYFYKDRHSKIENSPAVMYDNANDYWAHACEDERFYRRTPVFFSQINYLRDVVGEGGISDRVQTLLRYESLSEDWIGFAEEHNVSPLQHKNKSNLRPDTHWSTEFSDEVIASIGELYADDFKHLDYERIS